MKIAQWKSNPNCTGEEVTLEKLRLWWGEGSRKRKEKGMVELPQWNICPRWFVIPVLHMMIGLVNDVWVIIRLFVNKKVELVSDKEQALRVKQVDLSNEYQNLDSSYTKLKEEKKAEEALIRMDLRNAKKQLTETKNKLKRKRISDEDRVKLGEAQSDLERLVTCLDIEKDKPMKLCEPEKKKLDEAKEKLDKVEKDILKLVEARDGNANGMEVYLEAVLKKDAKIYIDAFFGRKMNGVCFGCLLDNATKILDHVHRECKRRLAIPRNIESPCTLEELENKLRSSSSYLNCSKLPLDTYVYVDQQQRRSRSLN